MPRSPAPPGTPPVWRRLFVGGTVLAFAAFLGLAVLQDDGPGRGIASAVAAPAGAAAPAGSSSAAPAVSPPAPADAAAAHTQVEGGVARFYFLAEGHALPPDALPALRSIVKEVALGEHVVIAPYAAAAGAEAERGARRAALLRDTLRGLGLPADKLVIRGAAAGPLPADPHGARRVDVVVVD